ncbi:hypothetical protein EJ04DRAFT_570807 [Polyplosphaeria fusca]|uniref:Uncharacterized protein n=1 Tax=Polyplosphaeria fusca TaxID=682080 RepID=A0A9P4QGQ9_9PLEO|nr:hypothetical protein EJ04DRAFT_570807 [Polyplosphaeria fusca]
MSESEKQGGGPVPKSPAPKSPAPKSPAPKGPVPQSDSRRASFVSRRRSSAAPRRASTITSTDTIARFIEDAKQNPISEWQDPAFADFDWANAEFDFNGLDNVVYDNGQANNAEFEAEYGNFINQYPDPYGTNLANDMGPYYHKNQMVSPDLAQYSNQGVQPSNFVRQASQELQQNPFTAVPGRSTRGASVGVNPGLLTQGTDPLLSFAGSEADPFSNEFEPFSKLPYQSPTTRSRTRSLSHPLHSPSRYGNERRISKESAKSSNTKASGSSWSEAPSERTYLKNTRRVKHRISVAPQFKAGEAPRVDEGRPWVRINATTVGKTTRTSKINHYKADYQRRAHPVGNWSSQHFDFQYTKDGEFKERSMSAAQIKEFILQYPRDHKTLAKLKLWIQKGPTDSARRYLTTTWSKCRMRECPANVWQTGTILHGHYRVAFDEKWHRDRENSDPFLVAGYVHLYCMERFLDFPDICKYADVEVDTRQLTNEPNGKFAASLAGQPECGIAQDFVERCRRGKDSLRKSEYFHNYPEHKSFRKGEAKPYKDTQLAFWMTKIKADTRPAAQIRQFMNRGLKDTHLLANMGDLKVLFREVAKQKTERKKAVKSKKRKEPDSDSDSESDDELPLRKSYKQHHPQKGQDLVQIAANTYGPRAAVNKRPRTNKPSSTRRARNYYDDEESDSDDEYLTQHKRARFGDDDEDEFSLPGYPPSFRPAAEASRPRRSPREKKTQTNYEQLNEGQPIEGLDEQFAPQAEIGGPVLDEAELAMMAALNGENFTVEDFSTFDFDSVFGLSRRRSSTVPPMRRASSILRKPRCNSRRDSRRVQIGGTTTHHFDQSIAMPRYSLRNQDKVVSGRVAKRGA